MGDRVSINIEFGGIITKTQAAELLERCQGYNLYTNSVHWTKDLSIDDLHDQLVGDEINYGLMDEVTSYCEQHNIWYDCWSAAGGSFGESTTRYLDGRAERVLMSDGMFMTPLLALLDMDNLVSGWANVLDLARFMKRVFPKLEIV